jgi:hypothetical protein
MHRIPPYSLRRQPWKWGRTIATLTGWPECTSAFSRYVETHSILHSRQHDSAVSGVGQFRGLGVKTVQGMQGMKERATILLLLQVHRPASLPTHPEIIGVASVRYSRSRIGQSLRASRRGALISSTSCRCFCTDPDFNMPASVRYARDVHIGWARGEERRWRGVNIIPVSRSLHGSRIRCSRLG